MIKNICLKFGQLVATLLMVSPLIILVKYNYNLENPDCLFFFICSILYDIYFYNIIVFENDKQSVKDHYYKSIKNADKKLNLNLSDKEKFDNLENYVEELLEKYF